MTKDGFQADLAAHRVRQVSVVMRSCGAQVWVNSGPTLEDSGGEPVTQWFRDLSKAYAFVRSCGYRGTVAVDDGEDLEEVAA